MKKESVKDIRKIELDECYSDDGCTFSLDSGYDWIDDVVAWMPLPEPYRESEGVCKDCYYNDGEVHAECVICDKTERGE